MMNKLLKNMYINSKKKTDINDIYKMEKLYIFDSNFNCSNFYIGIDVYKKRHLLPEPVTDNIYNTYVFPLMDNSYLFFSKQHIKETLRLSFIKDYHNWYENLRTYSNKYISKIEYTKLYVLDVFALTISDYINMPYKKILEYVLQCINAVKSIELLSKM